MASLGKRIAILGSERPLPVDACITAKHNPHKVIEVNLLLRHRPSSSDQPPLEALGQTLSQGQRYLTHADYEARYGADPEDLEKIKDFAQQHELQVIETHMARRTVTLAGTIQAFNAAFDIDLASHKRGADKYLSHTRPVSLPVELAEIVTWVFGLHTQPLKHGQALGLFSGEAGELPVSYSPPQLAELYDFPPHLDGQGVCVGVLEIFGGYKKKDMKTFLAEVLPEGKTRPKIVTVGRKRWAKGQNYFYNFEATMDVQIVASVAPGAKIVVYFSDVPHAHQITAWTYFNLISRAVFDTKHRPAVLSFSAGFPEALFGFWKPKEMCAISELFQIATLLFGITICVPSGDSGSIYPTGSSMTQNPSLAYFPASSPWVLSCGGTSLTVTDNQITDEVVWNRLAQNVYLVVDPKIDETNAQPRETTTMDPACSEMDTTIDHVPLYSLGASGGGVSAYFKRPAWQAAAQVPQFSAFKLNNFQFSPPEPITVQGRGVPDVAANADLLTGYKFLLKQKWRSGGGTSASAPLWAGLIARLNQGLGRRVGFLNPILYDLKLKQRQAIFRDIVQGNNGGYEAGPGKLWNPCTGLGSPRGTKLLAALKDYFSTTEG